MKLDPFVHLHVHTDYSILDGHSTVLEVARRAAELHQPAVAITDHGSLGGIRKLWESCNEVGVKPVVGIEAYVAPDSRLKKEPVFWGEPSQKNDDISGRGAYTHMTLLAMNDTGLRNLYRLNAAAQDGFYYKPRIDLESLASHSDGLIATTGCAGGAVATRIRLGQLDAASDYAGNLKDIFRENLFIEIMSHNNPVDEIINPSLIDISKTLRIPLVATNDSHYTSTEDAYSHDILLCIQTYQQINGNRSFKFEGEGYHLRSATEMEALFREIPSAIQGTLAVAERVEEYQGFRHLLRMPRFELPAGYSNSGDYLTTLCNTTLRRLNLVSDRYTTQLKYELETIINLGFADYFLVLADVVGYARERGIKVGPGRGSAGGALPAYLTGITDLDPVVHGLLFERFLNPERVSLPDIDIDIQDDRRDELLAWVRIKYGEDCVAHLGTYGTIGAKSALHDSARVLGRTRRASDLLTYRLPRPQFGRQPTLSQGNWDGISDSDIIVVDAAKSLEGKKRNQGVHSAGVVISPEPLVDIIPLYKNKGQGPWVTSFVMEEVEAIGLPKIDFLGLKNLTIIDNAEKSIDVPWDLNILSTNPKDLEDEQTYRLLASGNTFGVFQLDSPGMQQLLRSIKPDRFGDISAVLALYRPGPMGVDAHNGYARRKNRKERVSYPHRELEEPLRTILGDTYGLVVYQEQVLEILRVCCGYTYATAEGIFNAMRKKDTKKMMAAKPDYKQRMVANGYSEDAVEALWNVLVPFSDYSFNIAHTTGYGVVSYWTAYLKANFPNEYMAALLSSEENPTKLPIYLEETQRMGVPILPPDINESLDKWTPTTDGIRYGLASIKGFGENSFGVVEKKRPFKSLDDFFRRADRKTLNSKTLGALVMAGALDSLCPHRSDLYLAREELTERALADRALARKGQRPLYAAPYEINSSGSIDTAIRKKWEEEVLGTVLTAEDIELVAERWLQENEFYFIREVVQKNPGRNRLILRLGYAKVDVGMVHWTDRVKTQIEALGAVGRKTQ